MCVAEIVNRIKGRSSRICARSSRRCVPACRRLEPQLLCRFGWRHVRVRRATLHRSAEGRLTDEAGRLRSFASDTGTSRSFACHAWSGATRLAIGWPAWRGHRLPRGNTSCISSATLNCGPVSLVRSGRSAVHRQGRGRLKAGDKEDAREPSTNMLPSHSTSGYSASFQVKTPSRSGPWPAVRRSLCLRQPARRVAETRQGTG